LYIPFYYLRNFNTASFLEFIVIFLEFIAAFADICVFFSELPLLFCRAFCDSFHFLQLFLHISLSLFFFFFFFGNKRRKLHCKSNVHRATRRKPEELSLLMGNFIRSWQGAGGDLLSISIMQNRHCNSFIC
jgi:hypothetical protein